MRYAASDVSRDTLSRKYGPREEFPTLRFLVALFGPAALPALYYPCKAEFLREVPWAAALFAFDTITLGVIAVLAGLYATALLCGRENLGLTCLAMLVGVLAPCMNVAVLLSIRAHFP
jgi:hypothetical protein